MLDLRGLTCRPRRSKLEVRMATPPRIFEDDCYYHIYNRGHGKQQIFYGSRDYERFLEKVVEYKKKHPVEILAYCLMPNHIHFLLKQILTNSISKFMSDLCNSHSRYFNIKYESVGSLYQGRFKAKKVEKDEYLIHLSRYIHLNPVGLHSPTKNTFEQLCLYRWSSLPSYLLGKSDEIVALEAVLQYFSSKDPSGDYKEFVRSNMDLKLDPVVEYLAFEE